MFVAIGEILFWKWARIGLKWFDKSETGTPVAPLRTLGVELVELVGLLSVLSVHSKIVSLKPNALLAKLSEKLCTSAKVSTTNFIAIF